MRMSLTFSLMGFTDGDIPSRYQYLLMYFSAREWRVPICAAFIAIALSTGRAALLLSRNSVAAATV